MKDRRGQGTVEFILLVFASLAALALLRQFNDGFRAYVSNYYGAYLTCLLETGELPSLGYDTTGECDTEYRPFTVAGGRPPVNSGNERGIPGRVQTSSANGKDSSAKANGKSSASADAGAAAGSSGGGGGVGTESNGPRLLGDNADGESRKVPLTKADGGGKGGTKFSQLNGYDSGDAGGGGRPEFVPAPLAQAQNDDADLRKANVPAPENTADESVTKRIPAEINKKKVEAPQDTPLTLPDFIKILLIIVLILIMLVFFGGQALQISKSGDK